MLFWKKKKAVKVWTRPGGSVLHIYNDILSQNHVLIAGASGSGKSVFVSGVLYALMLYSPAEKHVLFIDPKRVDYIEYQDIPHCIGRATTPERIYMSLLEVVNVMENRLDRCERAGLKITDQRDIYIIVDEYPDIVQTNPAAVKLIEKISRLGRAAKIHLIICTQRCTRDVINGVIAANMTAKVALHTTTEQESRNIIGIPHAADLPYHGKCIYHPPGVDPSRYDVEMVPAADTQKLIDYWIAQK